MKVSFQQKSFQKTQRNKSYIKFKIEEKPSLANLKIKVESSPAAPLKAKFLNGVGSVPVVGNSYMNNLDKYLKESSSSSKVAKFKSRY